MLTRVRRLRERGRGRERRRGRARAMEDWEAERDEGVHTAETTSRHHEKQ